MVIHYVECLSEAFLNLKWKHYRKFFLLLVFIYSVFVLSVSTVAYSMSKGFQMVASQNGSSFTEADMVIISVGNGMVCFSGAFLFIHAVIQVKNGSGKGTLCYIIICL